MIDDGCVQIQLRLDSSVWVETKDADPDVRAIYDRHYSRTRYRDGRRRAHFVGPGQKIVLRTPEGDAVFVWRRFRSADGQTGVNCAVFRNEGRRRSSTLIREAVAIARRRWPGQRFFTYVNPRAIRSPNPGFCFQAAGWRKCGTTKSRGLTILELPA